MSHCLNETTFKYEWYKIGETESSYRCDNSGKTLTDAIKFCEDLLDDGTLYEKIEICVGETNTLLATVYSDKILETTWILCCSACGRRAQTSPIRSDERPISEYGSRCACKEGGGKYEYFTKKKVYRL